MCARVVDFLFSYNNDEIEEIITRQYVDKPVIHVSMQDLLIYNKQFLEDLTRNPDKFIKFFEEAIADYEELVDHAINEIDNTHLSKLSEEDLEKTHVSKLSKVPHKHTIPPETTIEFVDPTPEVYHDIGAPRDDYIGKLVAFEGICKQASDNKPRVMKTWWECQRCGTANGPFDVSDTFDIESEKPHECQSCERQGPFDRVPSKDVREEYQQLRVQEPPGEAVNEASPREITVDAMGEHLIDRVDPGDRVTVVGILREDGDTDSTLLDTRLELQSIIPEEVQFEEVEFDDDDVEEIEELAASEELFEYITGSVSPSIYGYERAKLAVALQMFGGVTKHEHGNRKRGEIHIMFIGDPGVGKSQVLQSARNVAPRSVQSSGTGASSVGLTASAQKEKIGDSEEWTLQAGSLVLADGGLITIDELDNLNYTDQQALDEALSEGQLNVDKANVHATLKSRCSALMAANPEKGRFDPYEPLVEQFDMPKELLDRCDLVFPFRDQPDKEKDEAIIDTVIDTHQPKDAAADGGMAEIEETGIIPPDLFQKYVAYARRNFDPVLTDAAQSHLKDWYLNVRGLSKEGQISINTRMFEGALRLSQASARARLSDTVDETDTDRAIDLIMYMLTELGYDPEGGGFDVDMVNQGKATPTQRNRIEKIKDIITDLEDQEGAPASKVIAQADEMGIEAEDTEEEIEKLKNKGEIYEPSSDHYRVS